MVQHAHEAFHTYQEICGQPEAWADVLRELDQKMPALQALYQAHKPTRILFVGCGSPYYLARSAAPLARQALTIPAEAHPASDLWLYTDTVLQPGDRPLMVVISRSGETTEVLKAVERFRDVTDGPVVAVTCHDDSTLAKMVPDAIYTRKGQEVGLAQTRSFVSMFMAVQGIIAAFAGQPISARFRDLPALGEVLIAEHHSAARALGESTACDSFFFLGGGAFYGLACEVMLKLKEMSLTKSEAFHFLEFRHGPMTMVDHRTMVIGLMSETVHEQEALVLEEMRRHGASTLAITPHPLAEGRVDHQVVLADGLRDSERGGLYLPFLHMMIYYRTLLKGLNPDKPHNLNAVVNLDLA